MHSKPDDKKEWGLRYDCINQWRKAGCNLVTAVARLPNCHVNTEVWFRKPVCSLPKDGHLISERLKLLWCWIRHLQDLHRYVTWWQWNEHRCVT